MSPELEGLDRRPTVAGPDAGAEQFLTGVIDAVDVFDEVVTEEVGRGSRPRVDRGSGRGVLALLQRAGLGGRAPIPRGEIEVVDHRPLSSGTTLQTADQLIAYVEAMIEMRDDRFVRSETFGPAQFDEALARFEEIEADG